MGGSVPTRLARQGPPNCYLLLEGSLSFRLSFHQALLGPTGAHWAELVQELFEGGPVGAGAAGGLGEHPVAAGTLQGVDLELGLLVGGGDAGIAEKMDQQPGSDQLHGNRYGGGTPDLPAAPDPTKLSELQVERQLDLGLRRR